MAEEEQIGLEAIQKHQCAYFGRMPAWRSIMHEL